jgi:hypothetical protein
MAYSILSKNTFFSSDFTLKNFSFVFQLALLECHKDEIPTEETKIFQQNSATTGTSFNQVSEQ